MSARWESFYPYVQPQVPGCPEITIQAYLRDAAAQFCERSEVWVYDAPAVDTEAGVSDYYLETLGGSLVANVIAVFLNGVPLKGTVGVYNPTNPVTPMGTPTQYQVLEGQQIRLFPTPETAHTVQAKVVLKPSLSARGVEDFIFEAYGRAIASGAIASLALIPGKEWSNADLGAYHQHSFDRAADDAKGREMRRGNLRAKGVNFA